MYRRNVSAAVQRFAAALGIRLSYSRAKTPTWDGQVLQVYRIKLPWHLLHELGHFLAAPPELRHKPNFGLGSDPDTRIPTEPGDLSLIGLPERYRGTYEASQEAAAAFLCGVLMFRFSPAWEVQELISDIIAARQDHFWTGARMLHALGIDWWCHTEAASPRLPEEQRRWYLGTRAPRRRGN